jgi:hypothetical protein
MAKRVSRVPNDALTEIMLADHERSGDERETPQQFVEQSEPPPPEPEPLRIPPPDWRAEERARAEQEGEPAVTELEPPKSMQAQPAPKRGKSSTPRLDEFKRSLEQSP